MPLHFSHAHCPVVIGVYGRIAALIAGASKRVGEAAAQKAGGPARVTLSAIHAAALADRVMGKYENRRTLVYKKAAALFWGSPGAGNQNGGKKTMTENELRRKVVQTGPPAFCAAASPTRFEAPAPP